MKIKTSELTGKALDWAVGIATQPDGAKVLWHLMKNDNWKPSRSWAEGGPIIERELIGVRDSGGPGNWHASFDRMRLTFDGKAKHYHHQFGPTFLIAAMRCYVSSKLGEEVDVPEGLS